MKVEFSTQAQDGWYFTVPEEQNPQQFVEAIKRGVWMLDDRGWWINPSSITKMRIVE